MHIISMIQHRELPVLNGRRVDVRHLELALNAINDETSKKLVSIVYYENHNYEDVLRPTWIIDKEIPIFTKEPNYINRFARIKE